jgi:hypothetical protein
LASSESNADEFETVRRYDPRIGGTSREMLTSGYGTPPAVVAMKEALVNDDFPSFGFFSQRKYV